MKRIKSLVFLLLFAFVFAATSHAQRKMDIVWADDLDRPCSPYGNVLLYKYTLDSPAAPGAPGIYRCSGINSWALAGGGSGGGSLSSLGIEHLFRFGQPPHDRRRHQRRARFAEREPGFRLAERVERRALVSRARRSGHSGAFHLEGRKRHLRRGPARFGNAGFE